MKEFVFLTKQSIVDWATPLFGDGQYQLTIPKNGRELVVRHELPVYGLEIHVYTTVLPESDRSRGKGEDAIRFVLYDRFAGKPVMVGSKVLRVDGATTVMERCTERVKELIAISQEYAANDWFCGKCTIQRAHTIARKNKSTGEEFRGCALFPKCGADKALYLAQAYPLRFNPFKVESKTPIVRKPLGTALAVSQVHQEPKALTVTAENYLAMAAGAELVPTALFPQLEYPFPFFNVMQSSVVQSGAMFKDTNMVLGTATSSGKTIAAELAIAVILGVIHVE